MSAFGPKRHAPVHCICTLSGLERNIAVALLVTKFAAPNGLLLLPCRRTNPVASLNGYTFRLAAGPSSCC